MPVEVYRFGDFSLNCERFELCHKARRVKLERKPLELLVLLVTRHGQVVTREEIATRLWEQEVFVDIEHGINTAIRKIRQTLGDSPDLPQFVQTISGSGYRFVALVTEAEPEVVRPTESSSEAQVLPLEPSPSSVPIAVPAMAAPRHKFWFIIATSAVLLAATAVFTLGAHRFAELTFSRSKPPAITSLAIIPLDNLSGDPNQAYFAEGMTDELTTMLAKDSTLRIASRTSAKHFKDPQRSLPQIAHDLSVDGILEGSVSRASGQVHLTLQLIRADTDANIWAESYDRDSNEVAALPDEAARAVAKRLGSAVVSSSTPRYVNPEAHEAYIHGMYSWNSGANQEAGRYFLRAIELQPDYAAGWAGMSEHLCADTVAGALKPAESLPACETDAIKAVQLDDSLPDAHLALAGAIFFNDWDWARADKEILRTIELDPRLAESYHLRARMLQVLNRHDESIALEKKSTELDPFVHPWSMAQALMSARRFDDARSELQIRLKSTPYDEALLSQISICYHNTGNDDEAARTYVQVLRLTDKPESAAQAQRAFQRGSYKGLVQWELNDAREEAKSHYVPPTNLASLYAELGDRDHALALLEEGYRQHSPRLLYLQANPAFDFLHADPRYRTLVQKIGLPPAY